MSLDSKNGTSFWSSRASRRSHPEGWSGGDPRRAPQQTFDRAQRLDRAPGAERRLKSARPDGAALRPHLHTTRVRGLPLLTLKGMQRPDGDLAPLDLDRVFQRPLDYLAPRLRSQLSSAQSLWTHPELAMPAPPSTALPRAGTRTWSAERGTALWMCSAPGYAESLNSARKATLTP
jgi:hypothetical protein